MSVLRFRPRVKAKASGTPQGPQHPDILREIRRLWLSLQPATNRQKLGLELLSLGLELLELDADPDFYRGEIADLDKRFTALEELATFSTHMLSAFERASRARPEWDDRDEHEELRQGLTRALYPEQPRQVREFMLELEPLVLRVFAGLETVSTTALRLHRQWDFGIWSAQSARLLRDFAAALESNDASFLDLLGPVARWLEHRLRPAPTMNELHAFLTDFEAAQQRPELERELERERAAHTAELSSRLEELAAVAAAALKAHVEKLAADLDSQPELFAAREGGEA